MLAIAPELVDMGRAEASPAVTRGTPGALMPSDGNPTLATLAKGEDLLAAILDDLVEQVAVFIAKDLTDKPRPEAMQSVLR